jgi:hypothetical protein
MLKIKDNVGLKELEKYGIKYFNEDSEHIEGCEYECENKNMEYGYMLIPQYNREIRVGGSGIDLLYDLIQAGLVEKVKE